MGVFNYNELQLIIQYLKLNVVFLQKININLKSFDKIPNFIDFIPNALCFSGGVTLYVSKNL